MAHFGKDMAGQFTNILVISIGWVLKGNCNNFFVQLSAIHHLNYTNGIATNQAKRMNHLAAQHQNIQWVAIICQSARNQAIVGRIVSGSVQNAVKDNMSGFFVQLILIFRAFFNFNYRNKIIRIDTSRINPDDTLLLI